MRKLILAISLSLACAGVAAADTYVTADAIAARISKAIAARLPSQGHYRVTLSDPAYQLNLPVQAKGRYDIAALVFDPARQSFDATLGYTGQSGSTEYVRLGGGALAVIEVPAPARDMAIGETISESDLTTVEIAADRASATLLTSPESLIGQAARRTLRARSPLFAYDVRRPVVVKKGDLVTIVFDLPGIELTAQGQAQADAAGGDTVAVLNTHSRRTIEARVTGPGAVSVSAPGMTLAAQR
ncbi:MAG: flagellar basal body P-ring formation chaperone FlgA [Micropepsaceae bacterium]